MENHQTAVTAEEAERHLTLAVLAVQLLDQMKNSIRQVADEQGLSISQVDVLRRLLAHGPIPMRRLAEDMRCEASNLTGLVDRLEARSLVTREADPTDRRVRLLALTPAGEQLGHQMWQTLAQCCPLGTLDGERQELLVHLLREAVVAPTWVTVG